MLGNQVKSVYLGLGSNLGNRKRNIEKAKFMLIQKNIKLIKCSNYYESLSWPNPKNPKFLNIVIKITTSYNPSELLNICKSIETSLGRINRKRNSPRECDIDIIDYGNEMLIKNIILPHPRMHIRNFVLLPLFELNKAWIHPVLKHNIKSLILSLPNKDIRSIKQI
tara:strand:+ start:168 stop:665 length:498 start_codon:yes stop_codon:yes gene_type:complete